MILSIPTRRLLAFIVWRRDNTLRSGRALQAPTEGLGTMPRGLICLAAAMALVFASAAGAFAQSWPAKPIRLIVCYAPGGVTDVIARAGRPAAFGGSRPVDRGREQTGRERHYRQRDRRRLGPRRLHASDVCRRQHGPALDHEEDVIRAAEGLRADHRPWPRQPCNRRPSHTAGAFARRADRLCPQHPGELSYASPGLASPQSLSLEAIKKASGIDIGLADDRHRLAIEERLDVGKAARPRGGDPIGTGECHPAGMGDLQLLAVLCDASILAS